MGPVNPADTYPRARTSGRHNYVPAGEAKTEPYRSSAPPGLLMVSYAALFTAPDISFPVEARARSSEAMQITKHTMLTSNRLRFVRLIAKNSLVAMLRCTNPPTTSAIQPT